MSKITNSFAERKKLLASNPNLFLSRTRLSVRNLGLKVDDKTLKRVARIAVKKFWDNVAAGLAEPLEPEVLAEEAKEEAPPPSATRPVIIQQSKIVRSKDRVDAETKQLRSKGYGFVEFASHADALACLRWMNNNPLAFGYYNGPPKSPEELAKLNLLQKKPIVEFAIDNMLVVKKRDEIQKMKLRAKKAAAEGEGAGAGAGAGKDKRDRKRKRGGKEEEGKGEEAKEDAKALPAGKKGKVMKAAPAPAPAAAGGKAAKPAPAKREGAKSKQDKRTPGAKGTAAAPSTTGAGKKGAKGVPVTATGAQAPTPTPAQKRARPAAPATLAPKTPEEKAAKKLKAKARESAKEDKFNALVEGYKQKLFAAPSEKKRATDITRWFE